MSKCETVKCKKCGGSSRIKIIRKDLLCGYLYEPCSLCNGTGELSEVKPKADVRGVMTAEEEAKENEYIQNKLEAWNIKITDDNIYNAISEIIQETITALQSAHDVEVKELKRRVLKAIPKFKAYENELEQSKKYIGHGYNEAIAEITQSVRDAFKEEGK